ncbi:MAG: hypothetical protein V4511_01290 [Bacteroidota bacterium]
MGIIKYDLLIFDRWGDMIFHGITNRKEDPNDPATCEPFEYPELSLFDCAGKFFKIPL